VLSLASAASVSVSVASDPLSEEVDDAAEEDCAGSVSPVFIATIVGACICVGL